MNLLPEDPLDISDLLLGFPFGFFGAPLARSRSLPTAVPAACFTEPLTCFAVPFVLSLALESMLLIRRLTSGRTCFFSAWLSAKSPKGERGQLYQNGSWGPLERD